MDDLLLIFDVGSSALKAVLFSRTGAVVAAASSPVPTTMATDRSAEQNVEDWWKAALEATAALPRRENVAAIALSGSMQNLIALEDDGSAIGPAVLYSDRRLDAGDVEAMGRELPDDYALRTGNKLDAAHPILKLMRLDRYYPAGAEKAHFLFGAKDAVIEKLTGQRVIDPTTATTTGLFDIRTGAWDAGLAAAASVSLERLPNILPADAVVAGLLEAPAGALGLKPGIPVFNGAGDGAAATWGAFADRPGSAYVYLGTTGWVAATTPLDEADPPRDIYTLADPIRPDRAILISPFLTAGSALEWLADVAAVPVQTLLEAAEGERSGPLFLPYLAGERSPFEDQAVRGAFLGLDRNHRPGALCRSVLEGIAFAVRHNLENAGLPVSPLTAIGGGARSPLMRQLLADALGRGVSVPPESRDVPALGIYRMVAGELGFAPVEPQHEAETVEPQDAERAARRYRAYCEASQFARDIAPSLT